MSEMSDMHKLIMAMKLAKTAQVGMELTYFDVIELLGELDSLKDYIAELEEKQRWIPVSERLPEANEMSVSEHANYLLNEYGRLQFDYAAYCKPYGESLRNEARNNLEEYIAKLEAENDQLTAHDATERQDDKCSKPEPNVCEACGGDGTVVLTDGYGGQVIATAKCTYCNGTGRVNKERGMSGVSALIDIYKMTEVSVEARIRLLHALGEIVNYELGTNATEPLVAELVDLLNSNNAPF